ncbi:hypothetical protein [Piscinibacter terrae]|uniref:Uncharacterized protein n=1 Tax=Piscinibacter terrae TaxID=2496871 RepID=A0A3N7JXJ0_9BURK|nr:hypothetical protein [Albitalea terrae]RQP25559.1 hypothetical protein DZC73_00310 [Albitalea terrae]
MGRAFFPAERWTPARRKTDLVPPEPADLDPDEALARLRRLMNQLQSFAAHWDAAQGYEVHMDLRVAMSMAQWPRQWRH